MGLPDYVHWSLRRWRPCFEHSGRRPCIPFGKSGRAFASPLLHRGMRVAELDGQFVLGHSFQSLPGDVSAEAGEAQQPYS